MVGYALRKLAKENNLTVAHGKAYGSFHGYACTFFEGAGDKTLVVTVKFMNDNTKNEFINLIKKRDLKQDFRVLGIHIYFNNILTITFQDSPGTMKRIYSFIDWFFPLLRNYTYYGDLFCTYCGKDLGSDSIWELHGNAAFHIHPQCFTAMKEAMSGTPSEDEDPLEIIYDSLNIFQPEEESTIPDEPMVPLEPMDSPGIKLGAFLWKYSFCLVLLPAFYLNSNYGINTFPFIYGFLIAFGIYTIIAAAIPAKHFIYAMMSLGKPQGKTAIKESALRKWRRSGIVSGIGMILMAVLLFLARNGYLR